MPRKGRKSFPNTQEKLYFSLYLISKRPTFLIQHGKIGRLVEELIYCTYSLISRTINSLSNSTSYSPTLASI